MQAEKFFVVVFLREERVNVIIPINWIDADAAQIEKFLNYGVNRNQRYRCYYNENDNFDFHPNFDNFPIGNAVYPDEGCYIGHLLKFKRKYMVFYYCELN